ncbi:mtDNA inheritance, partitioning of the mitochondrial organelle [Coemansia sp. RSA 2320]|nr:mtDNA inheritance, partitioning of the mitochondrial organelle [Coemansia sp. RSA 2320]
MKEIITLQLGESANYVGTHFWNLQQRQVSAASDESTGEPLATEVFYSSSDLGRGRETHRPRVLIFDKVGNFGLLGQQPEHSEQKQQQQPEDAGLELWGGETEVYRQPLYTRGDASDPTGHGVRFWSDFSEVDFDGRSMSSVSGVEFGNSLGEMMTFQEGSDVFAGENGRSEVLEGAFRVFAEACDQLQGFQVLADACGGFAGFGAALMGKIRDEYPKAGILLYSVGDSRARDLGSAHVIDAAVAMATNLDSVSASVPMFVPAGLAKLRPAVQVDESVRFQTSAFMALSVAQWGHCLLSRARSLDDLISQATQQQYFKVAESLVAPGLQVGDGDTAASAVKRHFAACSDVAVGDLSAVAGLVAADRGTAFGQLLPGWPCVDLGQAVAVPGSFPRIFGGPRRERVGVAGLLCTTAGSGAHLQQLRSAVQSERSRLVKDYEREWIREVKDVLDSAIDRYAMIG